MLITPKVFPAKKTFISYQSNHILPIKSSYNKIKKMRIRKSPLLFIFVFFLISLSLLTSGCSKIRQIGKSQKQLSRLEEMINQIEKNLAEIEKEINNLKLKIVQAKKVQANNKKPPSVIKKIGYIKKLYLQNNQTYLELDEVQFFSGKEAAKAAIEDGLISNEKELGSDYYVRNKSKQVKTFLINPKVHIYLKTFNQGNQWNPKIKEGVFSLDTFRQVFLKNDSNNQILINNLYWLTIKNSIVVKIVEQPLIEEPCST